MTDRIVQLQILHLRPAGGSLSIQIIVHLVRLFDNMAVDQNQIILVVVGLDLVSGHQSYRLQSLEQDRLTDSEEHRAGLAAVVARTVNDASPCSNLQSG